MTNNDAVSAEELRITVEMGDDYTPSPELQSALDELRSVLESESSEVAGFGFEPTDTNFNLGMTPARSFSLTYGKIEFGYTENDAKGKK